MRSRRASEIKVDEIVKLVFQDYIDRDLNNLGAINIYWHRHLQPEFGGKSAARVTYPMLKAYRDKRRAEGAAMATVDLEFKLLSRAYSLAIGDGSGGLLQPKHRPKFPYFNPGAKNRRVGFFEPQQRGEIIAHLRDWQVLPFRFACVCGWRMNELFGLTWSESYNEEQQEVWVLKTKNKDSRMVPLVDGDGEPNELHEIIAEAKRLRREDAPWIFHYEGRQLNKSTWTKWWNRARKLSKVNRTLHDTRRTASRDLRNRGVDQLTRMRIIGHRTTSMDERYNIIPKQDIAAALRLPKKAGPKPTASPAIEGAQKAEISRTSVGSQVHGSMFEVFEMKGKIDGEEGI